MSFNPTRRLSTHSIRRLTFTCLALACSLLAWPGTETNAQQLRIESNVYREGRKEPIATTLTLIDNGFVYDFSLDPLQPDSELEIAIYDYNRKSINLLDCQRQVRLNLEQFEVLKMVEEQRAQLSQNPDLEFLVAPQFTEQTDIASGTISLENPRVSYRATCEKPQDMTALPIYYDAVDHLTRLASSDPERLPPFPRLALNQVIRKYNLMPTQIQMKLASEGLLQRDLQMRSEHSIIWKISTQDQQRIEQAKRKYMNYPVVSLGKFRGLKKEKTEAKNPAAETGANGSRDN